MKKIELPTAREARQQAKSPDFLREEKEYNEIARAIIAAVRNRKFQLFWYKEISQPVRDELTRLKYKVGPTETDRDGLLTTISWTK